MGDKPGPRDIDKRAEQSRAEQDRTEQEQSRGQSPAKHNKARQGSGEWIKIGAGQAQEGEQDQVTEESGA